MKLVLATFLALAVVGAANAFPTEASGRIIGGVNALEGEFPEICLIQWVFLGQQSNICACAILNGNHVVTAAHCITEAPTTGRLDVLVGVLDHTVVHPQRQRIAVLSHMIHEEYDAESPRRNDICIMRLAYHIVPSDWARFADLPAAGAVPSGVTILAGWGQTSTGILPPSATFLQKIQQPVLAFDQCRTALANFGIDLQEEYMCTGQLTGGIGVCNGDAGGPVLQNGVLLGIISFTTSPCAAVGGASVHVNIAHYIPWIRNIIG